LLDALSYSAIGARTDVLVFVYLELSQLFSCPELKVPFRYEVMGNSDVGFLHLIDLNHIPEFADGFPFKSDSPLRNEHGNPRFPLTKKSGSD